MRLSFVVVAAVLIRLAMPALAAAFGDPAVLTAGDAQQYLANARSLAAGQGAVGLDGPELARPPGYPLLLVPGVVLGRPLVWAVAAQAVLGGLTALVVGLAVRRRLGERAGWVAAAIIAFDAVLVAWSGYVMAEALLVFLVAVGVAALLEDHAGQDRRALAVAAGALALAAYAKPIASLVAPALAFAVVCGPDRRRRWQDAALVVGVSVLVLSPWMVRNGLTRGYWGFSSVSDRMLSFSAPAAVRAAREGREFSVVRREMGALQTPRFEDAGYGELRARGLATLAGAPLVYARIHLVGMARVLLAPGAMPLYEPFLPARQASRMVLDRGPLAGVRHMAAADASLLVCNVVLALPLLGLLAAAGVGLRRGSLPVVVRARLAALVLGFLLLSGGAWGQSRFRAPLVPMLAVLAAAASDRGRHAAKTVPQSTTTATIFVW